MGGSLLVLRVLCLYVPVCLFIIYCYIDSGDHVQQAEKHERRRESRIKSLMYATVGQAFSCPSTLRRSSQVYPVRCVACIGDRVDLIVFFCDAL